MFTLDKNFVICITSFNYETPILIFCFCFQRSKIWAFDLPDVIKVNISNVDSSSAKNDWKAGI
jgi:hypothetical protein